MGVIRIMVAVAAVSTAYLAVLVLDRRPVVEVTNAKITPEFVKAGDPVTFSFDAEPLRENACEGVVRTYEVDSAGALFLFETNRPLGPKPNGKHHYSREFITHRGLAAGPVRYGRDILHWCSTAQKVIWPMRDIREVIYTALPRDTGDR